MQYKSTGRGFVVEHIPFAENYRTYARSHFVKGYAFFSHLALVLSLFQLRVFKLLRILRTWYMVLVREQIALQGSST